MRLLDVGDVGVLVETADLDGALALHAAVARAQLPGVVDLVPAARTVLVRVDPRQTSVASVRRVLEHLEVQSEERPAGGRLVEVPVSYDGPDLDDVARLAGLDVDEVVAAHTGQEWTAAFAGFAPGFAYLVGGDERLEVPRRDDARTTVPAGSVGLAGSFSGIYPRSSPGGWQLIGRTDLTLWDLDREPPALLEPGVRVRFSVAS